MKKIFLALLIMILVGCTKDMNNTPIKRVEVFLSSYQSLSDEAIQKINSDIGNMGNLNEDEKNEYSKLWKKHYQAMKYEIKDETIDGDDATVETEIEIFDYSKILTQTNNYLIENPNEFNDELGNYSFMKFNDYRLNKLKNANEKVKYIINFKLKKMSKSWVLQDLTDEEYLKLSGMYVY